MFCWLLVYVFLGIVASALPNGVDCAATILALWGLVFLCAKSFEERRTVAEKLSHGGVRAVQPIILIFAFCAGAGLNLAFSGLLSVLHLPDAWVESYAEASSQYKDPTNALMFKTVFLIPILEETVFRGLIGDRIGRVVPKRLAVPLAALIFAVMHGTLIWCAYAFISGLLLTAMYFRCNSILPCICFHIAFNASNYLWIKILPLPNEAWAYAVTLALGAVICIGFMIPMFIIKPKTMADH